MQEVPLIPFDEMRTYDSLQDFFESASLSEEIFVVDVSLFEHKPSIVVKHLH